MGCSLTDPVGCLTSLAGGAAGSIADSAFSDIAKNFADAAGSAVNWLWNQISGATAISLSGPAFGKDMAIVTTLAVVVATGLFVIQVIASVLRRDHSGLTRALKGLLIAFVGSVAAIAITTLLLAAVDSVSAGLVSAATGDSMQAMGTAILSATAITAIVNPAVALLLALVVLGAVVFVWGAMMVRKLLIIVAAVFAPLAFAGATSDISTSWVRKWIETMVALVISKLILVIIFVIGLGVLTGGLGEVSGTGTGASAGQSITQTVIGALILLMAGFAPWLAIKLVHFGGEHFGQIHGHAQSTLAGAQTVAAVPRKAQSLARGVAEDQRGGSGASVGAMSGSGPSGSLSTRISPDPTIPSQPSSGPAQRGVSFTPAGVSGGVGAAAGVSVGATGALTGAAGAAKTAVDKGTGHIADASSGVAPTSSPPTSPSPTSAPKGKSPAGG
jgi:type IV secretion system protein TrbL